MKIREIVSSAIDEWKSENTAAKIKQYAFKMLNAKRDEIIAKMAGFNDHWHKWEVDHCNNRMSQVNDYIKNNARDAVHQWIDENFDDLPKPSSELIKALSDDYKKMFQRYLDEQLRDLAYKEATLKAIDMVKEFTENDIDLDADIEEEEQNTDVDYWN